MGNADGGVNAVGVEGQISTLFSERGKVKSISQRLTKPISECAFIEV
jgi:hypothetical protein